MAVPSRLGGMPPEAICPHCHHEWRTHRDLLCYRCNQFHTVCGMCVDFGICFTEPKERVHWEEEEEEESWGPAAGRQTLKPGD